MIGVVIPAHNEQHCICAALNAVRTASSHPGLAGEAVEVLVVLDDCVDTTGVLAVAAGAMTLALSARNVGVARAAGADALLARGARWLAFTDADTVVSPSWLTEQLALGTDAVCGSVSVDDWSPHGVNAGRLREHFGRTYSDRDGHRHIHGANLGVSAEAYRRVGGFLPMACSEDVALVRALEAAGARIAWSARPRVTTSARVQARAVGGFADALLLAVAHTLAVDPTPA